MGESMRENGAEKSAPLILHEIKAPEVFQMVRILKLLGFGELSGIVDEKTRRALAYKAPLQQVKGGGTEPLPRDQWTEAQIEAETRYQVALSGVLMKVLGLIIERIGNPELETAVYGLLALGTGANAKQIRALDALDFIDLLDRYVSREGFSDFFTRAWKLFVRSENQSSQISSIAATAIRMA